MWIILVDAHNHSYPNPKIWKTFNTEDDARNFLKSHRFINVLWETGRNAFHCSSMGDEEHYYIYYVNEATGEFINPIVDYNEDWKELK